MKRLKQIGALLAIAVLIGFGLGAMIFAFIDTPFAHKALTVCLYCAITVPVLIYAMMLVAKVLSHRDENDKSDKGEKLSAGKNRACLKNATLQNLRIL